MLDAHARAAVLAGSATFSPIPADERAVLAEIMATERFAAGATVCEIDEPASSVFVIASGELTVWLRGRDAPVRTLGPGDVVGEYGMLVGFVRTATLRASTDLVVLSLDYERFKAYLMRFPHAMFVLFQQAVRRLVHEQRRD